MKFIKKYKLFEGIRQISRHDDMETVKEICYDLTDEGNWNIEYNTAGSTIDPGLYGIKHSLIKAYNLGSFMNKLEDNIYVDRIDLTSLVRFRGKIT